MSTAPMAAADVKPFELRRDTGDLAEGIAAMAARLHRSSMARVLAEATRTAERKGATQAFAGMTPKPVDWYCFDAKDNATADWYPQGVACASEAGRSEPVLAASWYWKPTDPAKEKGVRLTFLSTATRKYEHVLLVRPRPDGSYKPINIHAGGIAWYGDTIYVADTNHGMRTFDLRNVFDLTAPPAPGPFLKYRFVLPQADQWSPATGPARFSFATIDRTVSPHALLSGEYADTGPAGRVARWRLHPDGSLAVGGDGVAIPMDAYTLPKAKIQGAQSHDGTWYLSQAADAHTNGSLVVVSPQGRVTTRKFPVGPEDLTFWREKKTLWSLTEFRGKRLLFAVAL
jgi:hypothetical protein